MKIMSFALFLVISATLAAQSPIPVYQGTVKIAAVSEDTIYFALAKGDQLLFDFEEANGREVMEFEVLQYPHYSKFREDNKSKMQGRKIVIGETAVYWFRLANRSIYERVCKLNIRRIPASASTKNFKTTVAWKTISDTTYKQVTEKYVTRRDTTVINRELAVTVHAAQSQYGPSQSPDFDLPGNTIAWSFYIGVNQPGQLAYQQAAQRFAQSNNTQSKIPGYNPLAALALTGKSDFARLENGQAITYSLVDPTNAALAQQNQPFKSFRSKKVSNDFTAMKEPREGKLFFYLYNDAAGSVDVMVKIAAVVVYERTSERPAQKMEIIKKKMPIVPTARPN
jgi:hypothetical protein